ncbi:pilus assembly protein PilE [Trinickia symbiotica]|uniref:Pilus assembly protein PilE n=1 Tax=Trinickia symbiotica TaxID=863227 RepID=A0A2T3XX19_9BURK|nr:prepilin-type N-terminal cleavage/methylation domain-containing protein [Trinickia symbiotica]PTB21059.1 pilus assembly protein PilE [Trinickia symbiotica]
MRACTERAAGAAVARRRTSAFSLLELVIALAIVALMAAYAVPTYVRHTARGHWIAVVTALYQAAQLLEANGGLRAGKRGESLPAGLDQSPSQGGAVYRLHVLPGGGLLTGGYVIEAEPVASGPMGDDACGVFVLDSTGRRSNRTAAMQAPRDGDCWSAR